MQLFGALASPYVATRVYLFEKLKGLELQPVMPAAGSEAADELLQSLASR